MKMVKMLKLKLGETVTVKGDGSVTTKVIEEGGKAKLQVGLNKDVTIGNDNEPGTITVKGEDGKDSIALMVKTVLSASTVKMVLTVRSL